MNPLFEVHILNDRGKEKAREIAHSFDTLLGRIEVICGIPPNGSTRELALVKTKLEEACFFAKKAMANVPENQA